jgi:hypothetical protein
VVFSAGAVDSLLRQIAGLGDDWWEYLCSSRIYAMSRTY